MLESNKTTPEAAKILAKDISLPKGGGAIKGIGDSFKTNLFSGAGTYSISIPVTPARGFEPKLSIAYSSGAGNGVFGLGFSLSLSKVSVKTNLRIPKYDGTDDYELDGEGLVIQSTSAMNPNPRNDLYEGQTCQVTNYLPQIESSFSKIEHWQNKDTGLSFWKVISADNTMSYYGIHSQIANPENTEQRFQWLIDQSTDNKGNQIIYNYVAENAVNIPDTTYELNRSNTANRYIDTIQYGNYYDASGKMSFAFELVFNYTQNSQDNWTCRPDPFSFYNSGFEIRTYRLCHNIQLVHIFPEELGKPTVVKEIAFTYENIQQYTPIQFQGMSMLTKASYKGFRSELTEPQSLPPLEFGYSTFQPAEKPEFKMLFTDSGTIPGYLNETQFLPVDLNGEGLPGFLVSNSIMSLYLEPLGFGKYKLPMANANFPVNKNIKDNESTLIDLDGNGQLELVVNSPNPGFYAQTLEGNWNNFVPFERYPNVISDPEMELVDLSATGSNDLLLVEKNNLTYFPSAGKNGYNSALNVPRKNDFPLIKRGFRQELVTFANIFGDGLSHRVKITRGSVECWPCLGYGQFGKKVTLANAPLFEENFDTNRLFLADIDGSGTIDLAYVYPDRVELFMNQSGNSFSEAVVVYFPELFGTPDRITFSDILGNGTTCLVFTKIAPIPRHYYYNFSGESTFPDGKLKLSLKPYLLNTINNNMGSVSYINYCSSTKFILEDKQKENPWVTRLPFPVQVVEEINHYEVFSASRYVTKYKYHDGYYDPIQKQFMGFGFIESWDTETYETFQAGYSNPDYPLAALNKELFVPPIYTKTWYQNGAPPPEQEKLSAKYKSEYFNKDTNAYHFPNNRFSPDLYTSTEKTFSEAYKALASKVLRTEVYALDETPDSATPYSIEESNYSVILTQAATEDCHAVFMVNPHENITYHYERNHKDPRVEQNFILQTDPLSGQPMQSCSINLPRRDTQAPNYPEQHTVKGILTTFNYYNSPPADVHMRLRGIKYEQQSFNLLNIDNPPSGYFSFDDINEVAQLALQNIIPYGNVPSVGVQAQQYSKVSCFFYDPGIGPLPLGTVSPQVLLHHVSTAEFTNDNIAEMFGQRLTQDVIQQMCGYVYDPLSGYWENHGLTQQYNTAEGFYTPSGTRSDLGVMNGITYDAYYLAPLTAISYISIAPPVTNVVTVTMDYQAMAPRQLVDVNGNVSQALFDALGQVIVTSLFGTENGVEVGGMRLYEYNGKPAEYQLRTTATDGKPISFESIIKNTANKEYYLQGASSYFYYALNACLNQKQPVNSIHLQNCNYANTPGITSEFACQTSISYNDGLSRSLANKAEVESEGSESKWLVSGRSVYNNKGKVCESYLPYFSDTPFYQTQQEITDMHQVQPPTITHYDPLSRIVRVDTPKGFFSKVTFTPWEHLLFDEDDTVIDSVYYINFMASYPEQPTQDQIDEKQALELAAGFYDTYTTSVMDNMGNVTKTIQLIKDQTITRQLVTSYALDIQGRKVTETDPRLYAENVSKGEAYYNFKYQYSMSNEQPLILDSVDAGIQKHFNNIFGELVWSLSARDYCQVIYYDGLQRQTQLLVKKVLGTDPITGFSNFNLVEQFTYGEAAGLPANSNLRGQIYLLKDLSGIVTNSSYSMLGNVLQTTRQMTSVYKSAINWHDTVPLETSSSTKIYSYSALNLLLSETIKENELEWNITANTYNLEGLLHSISVTTNGVKTDIIKNITYDANRKRTLVQYGNGITTTYRYETSTLHLIRILSKNSSLSSPIRVVQDIGYTYDPVGNVTCIRDSSIDTVFNNNQKVDPVSTYQYDSLYRLTRAAGRQHPGINSNTYKNNTKDGSFMQSLYSQLPINDAQAIENYKETYSFDDSGNLIKKQHIAVSSQWTMETPVLAHCNRLQELEYDASGNQRQLAINNLVTLNYNCCENLVSASIIERPDENNDSDYYVYNNLEQRTRKVNEKFISTVSLNYIDTIYFDNYEVQRKGSQATDGTRTTTTNRQTLRIMDGNTCVAIIYHWINGGQGSTAASPAADQLRYQIGNNLGSVTIELDEQGLLVSYEEYFPYGGTSFIAGSKQVDVSLKTYRYSGKECDNSTGLYYYGMRYYIPWLGRWLKPDPAGTVDGLNLYAFVGGNPISNIDKNGLMLSSATRTLTRTFRANSTQVPRREFHFVVGSGHADKKELPKTIRKSNKNFRLEMDSPVIHTTYNPEPSRLKVVAPQVKTSSEPVTHNYIERSFDITKLHKPETMDLIQSVEKETGTPLQGIIMSFPRSEQATIPHDHALVRSMAESFQKASIDVPMFVSTTDSHPTIPTHVLAKLFAESGLNVETKTFETGSHDVRETFSYDGTKSVKILRSKIRTIIATKKTPEPL